MKEFTVSIERSDDIIHQKREPELQVQRECRSKESFRWCRNKTSVCLVFFSALSTMVCFDRF